MASSGIQTLYLKTKQDKTTGPVVAPIVKWLSTLKTLSSIDLTSVQLVEGSGEGKEIDS